MNILETKIVTFSNTCLFIYSGNNVIIPPTIVNSGDTLATSYNQLTDVVVEAHNIEDLMIEFDKLGLILPIDPTTPIEPTWHDKSRGVQLYISYENNATLMQGEYGLYLLDYFKNIIPPAPTFNEPEGVYIYLCELYLEHRTILEKYGARIAFATEELRQKSEISIRDVVSR